MRSLAAVEYVRRNSEIRDIIFSGGKTRGNQKPSEAEMMQNYFLKAWKLQEQRAGVDAAHSREFRIHLEENSCDTEGNAEYTMRLLQERYGDVVKNILLLTDATHMVRAVGAFKRHNAEKIE